MYLYGTMKRIPEYCIMVCEGGQAGTKTTFLLTGQILWWTTRNSFHSGEKTHNIKFYLRIVLGNSMYTNMQSRSIQMTNFASMLQSCSLVKLFIIDSGSTFWNVETSWNFSHVYSPKMCSMQDNPGRNNLITIRLYSRHGIPLHLLHLSCQWLHGSKAAKKICFLIYSCSQHSHLNFLLP